MFQMPPQFPPWATALGDAIRHHYPTPTSVLRKFSCTWNEEESPLVYLTQNKDRWTVVAGRVPPQGSIEQNLLRKALLQGLPADVRNKVEENHGLDEPGWVRHVTQHMKAYQKQKQQEKEEMARTAARFLRLNLAEAGGWANGKKKTTKPAENKCTGHPL